MLQSWDEALLLVLRMQPSEIDELDMERYWFWVDVCRREIDRRNEIAEQMNR
ncbi:Lambda G-pre-tape measure protein [Pseudomonas sp. MRSN 12121]|nr:Lambda G-pre-tape measure protein [Pseudomonas sp. MRSN 12121]